MMVQILGSLRPLNFETSFSYKIHLLEILQVKAYIYQPYKNRNKGYKICQFVVENINEIEN